MRKKKAKRKELRTLAQSIPYERVFANGMMEVEPGVYSKSYKIPEINFKMSNNESQMCTAELYAEFMGTFDPSMTVEVTLYNKTVDIGTFQEQMFLEMEDDALNGFREEYNDVILRKMTGAKNNTKTEKILTVSVSADSDADANEKFSQVDNIVVNGMAGMTKQDAPALTANERLEILNSIYNQDSTAPLCIKREVGGRMVESFSIENCIAQGITTKEVIAPSGMQFSGKKFMVGDTIGKCYYITNYPTWLRPTLLTDIASIPANLIVSAYMNVMDQYESLQLFKNKRTDISSILVKNQKKAAGSFIDASLISPDVQDAKDETETMMHEMMKDNKRMFTVNVIVTLFAPDEEKLAFYENQLKMVAGKNLVTVKSLDYLQENAFNSCLPLANNQLKIERLMSSDSVGMLVPFSVKEVNHKGGKYYGLNASSNNLIIYDRKSSDVNSSGCILGIPGSGKSMAAKLEIIGTLLSTKDDVYVIDPEGEYRKLAAELGGSTVRIANGSNIYINPFDMNINDGGDKVDGDKVDPIKFKTDFIETICEIAVGGRYGLSPIQKSIIDRCTIALYEDYMQRLNATGEKIDYENAPTMEDFYNLLCEQPQPEAQGLALSLERYVKGAYDIFSRHTNVNVDNRFVVYDIKDIGQGLKELGLQICLDNIWNKMIANHEKGIRTWIYIDEFYLMMQKPTASAYIVQIWKCARKWGGIPTAITQNVEDLLKNEEARTIINTSPFLLLLRQSPMNKTKLCQMLDISREEEKYLDTVKPGRGLLRINNDIIPVDNSFPADTGLYRIISTNPEEH